MARNGSGTMSIPYPDFVAGTTIVSSEVDANFSTLVDEITNSIAADGQTTPTANLPMGGFTLTGLGPASSATDSARLRDVQDQAWAWGGTATGTANALTLTVSPSVAAYAAGQAFRFIASLTNTAAATVNIDSLGVKDIQNGGAALKADDIISGQMYEIVYDGTQFQINSLIAFRGLPDGLEIMSADAGTGPGVILSLYHNSGSPAANDILADIDTYGEDSADNKELYTKIRTQVFNVTDGNENGVLSIFTKSGGTLTQRLRCATGVIIGAASGGDQGADTLNASTLYEDGTALSAKYEAIDADILRADTGDTLTAGFLSDSYSGGTVSSGTYTPAPQTGEENFQHITNGGAFTLAPPASPCTVVLEITNNASAGTITTSGFTQVIGDSFTTTISHAFVCYITKTNSNSVLNVVALQ